MMRLLKTFQATYCRDFDETEVGSASIFAESQRVNIVGFVVPILSIASNQLCCYNTKEATHNIQ